MHLDARRGAEEALALAELVVGLRRALARVGLGGRGEDRLERLEPLRVEPRGVEPHDRGADRIVVVAERALERRERDRDVLRALRFDQLDDLRLLQPPEQRAPLAARRLGPAVAFVVRLAVRRLAPSPRGGCEELRCLLL